MIIVNKIGNASQNIVIIVNSPPQDKNSGSIVASLIICPFHRVRCQNTCCQGDLGECRLVSTLCWARDGR